MDAVAYPDPAVAEFVTSSLVPLRIPANDPVFGPRFKVKWTPTLLILDADGVEHQRTFGFFSPDQLIPSLLLGMGKLWFDRPERSKACGCFDRIITGYPRSHAAPEAVYLNGVSRYIETHDVSNLVGIYDRLAAEYPGDQWLMRADPYRLLKN